MNKQKQTHKYREQISGWQRGEGCGVSKTGDWDKRYKLPVLQ